MKTNKTIGVLTAALALLLFAGGCVNKGSDPVVVNAERVTEMAVDAFDGFLRWEKNNREALRGTPEIKETADFIRANAHGWLQSARAMTKAYKENRTPQNKANLNTAIKVLETVLAEVTAWWSPVKASIPPAMMLALLALLLEVSRQLPKWVADMKGRSELTPEEEAELDKRIAELKAQDHWKIEP